MRVAGASYVFCNNFNSRNEQVVVPQRFGAMELLSDSACGVVKPELLPPIVTLVPPKQSPCWKQNMSVIITANKQQVLQCLASSNEQPRSLVLDVVDIKNVNTYLLRETQCSAGI